MGSSSKIKKKTQLTPLRFEIGNVPNAKFPVGLRGVSGYLSPKFLQFLHFFKTPKVLQRQHSASPAPASAANVPNEAISSGLGEQWGTSGYFFGLFRPKHLFPMFFLVVITNR